ncbi:hypothetical protein NQ317_001014 [Molorchus minor]|uniref:Phosphodiesterase n=1 Tax=Molorchus minor TaxID=1323400 RepID=A0ABQ9JB86_9CUCU|nr:hypothetical protein NQ317_001014 [Molorchus minor]
MLQSLFVREMVVAPDDVPPLQRAFSKEDWVLLDAMGCGPTPACSGKFLTMHKRRRKKLTTRSLQQDHAILDDIHHGQVQKILDRSSKWAFNAFTLETVAGGRSLPVFCVHLFHWYGLLDYFQLDVVHVWKLFTLIEEGYHSTNPYHNSIHATDVTQAMHCFLQEEKIRQHITPLEIMASLIGAVAHDLDHPGVNQHFLISTSNHLAILYENMSVLENHHWRSAIGCLLESGVADQLLPYRSDLEQQIRDLILATDINRQQEFLTKFKKFIDEDSLDLTKAEHRHFILQIALKCADISNPTRPWDISHKWSIKVCDEFFRQGEFERQLNLPVTSICDQQTTSVAKIQVAQENVEQAEEVQTELSDDEGAATDEEEATTKRSSETPSIHDFIPPPPKEIRRQSLAVPTLESLGVRRHSVPVNMEQSLPRTIYRRESLPTSRGVPFGRSPVSPQPESRASSGLREEDELLQYGSQSSDLSSSPHHSSTAEDQPDRPLSAENLLPEPSITSMTSSVAMSRLSSLLQGNTSAPASKCLTRQQTFPPPQPYIRMRYMSATAEMTTCPETAHEGDSRSNSSHGSHENISNSNNAPQYTIPSIAVLSPNNSCPPDLLVSEAPQPQKSSLLSNKRETEAAEKRKNLQNDPKRLPTTSLTRRRGSAPVSLPLSRPDEKTLPAGGELMPSDTQPLRRGSVPIEIAHYHTFDDESFIEEHLINITPVETTRTFWQYQRRGSAPMDLPPVSGGGERREQLTRHTSLNGKAGRRKKQLKRRSSGGPETVCLPESHSELLSRLLLQRKPENPDMLLARRRGSLPIEVLTVGHSGQLPLIRDNYLFNFTLLSFPA